MCWGCGCQVQSCFVSFLIQHDDGELYTRTQFLDGNLLDDDIQFKENEYRSMPQKFHNFTESARCDCYCTRYLGISLHIPTVHCVVGLKDKPNTDGHQAS